MKNPKLSGNPSGFIGKKMKFFEKISYEIKKNYEKIDSTKIDVQHNIDSSALLGWRKYFH